MTKSWSRWGPSGREKRKKKKTATYLDWSKPSMICDETRWKTLTLWPQRLPHTVDVSFRIPRAFYHYNHSSLHTPQYRTCRKLWIHRTTKVSCLSGTTGLCRCLMSTWHIIRSDRVGRWRTREEEEKRKESRVEINRIKITDTSTWLGFIPGYSYRPFASPPSPVPLLPFA